MIRLRAEISTNRDPICTPVLSFLFSSAFWMAMGPHWPLLKGSKRIILAITGWGWICYC